VSREKVKKERKPFAAGFAVTAACGEPAFGGTTTRRYDDTT
jgi:hypothetical protein